MKQNNAAVFSSALLHSGTRAHYEDPQYYDYAYKRRRHDVAFYKEAARHLKGPVLELGVGTARVAAAIAELGIQVVGVDVMPTMLARARERLSRKPERVRKNVRFVRGDFRRLRLGRQFPLVIAPFNAFMHLYTLRDIEQTLASCRRHLRRNGTLILDVLMPDLKQLSRDPQRFYKHGNVTHPSTGGRFTYSESFEYDAVQQVQLVCMLFQDVNDRTRLFSTPLTHRQFFPAELEALLHYNGFRIAERFGDFDRGPLTADSESQIIVANLKR